MITWKNSKGESVTSRTEYNGTVVPLPTHEGRVFLVQGEDVRVMSDVWDWITYAYILNAAGKIEKVPVSSWCFENKELVATVTVDATPEVLAAVQAIKDAEEAERVRREQVRRLQAAEAEWNSVSRGKTMTVFKGRKVAKGTTGFVFWTGPDGYGKTRVGLALDSTRNAQGHYANVAWTTSDNLVNALPFPHKDALQAAVA